MSESNSGGPELDDAQIARLEEIKQRVEAGKHLMAFVIEAPFNCTVDGNMVHIDAPCLGFGGTNTAAVLRFSLTAGSALGLRDYLNKLEFNSDGQAGISRH